MIKAFGRVFRHPGAGEAGTRGPTPSFTIARADNSGDGPRIAFGVWGDGVGGLSHWPRTLVVAAVVTVFASQALACNTVGVAHLGSAGADRVIVNFQDRRPALEIKDKARVDALAAYFMDLGGAWRSTVVTASTLNGDIHFYRADQSVESFWVSPTTLGRGGCYRALNPDAFLALISLLEVRQSDFQK